MVQAAWIATPGTTPVLASMPLGMSSAATGAPCCAMREIASAISRPRDALCARAEQAVDHEIGAGQIVTPRHPERVGDAQHRRGVAAHPIGAGHEDDPDVETRILQMTCHDEAVTAVVAGAADDGDATGSGEARARMHGGGGTGRLHQRDRGQAGILDGAAVEFPQVFGPPQRLHGS